MTRKKLTRDEREAACLLTIRRGDQWLIPEHLRDKPAKEIVAAVDYHHNVHYALTQDNRPQNIEPMLRPDHKVRTAKLDIPQIAKTKRITKKQEAFRQRLLAKSGAAECVAETSTKPKAKIQSRGFQKMPDGMRKDWKTGKPVKVEG